MTRQKKYKSAQRSAKSNYYSNLIDNSTNKCKTMWTAVSDLINIDSKPNFNSNNNSVDADSFNSFFLDKVDAIISKIPDTNSIPNLPTISKQDENFAFQHTTVEEVHTVIISLKNSTSLDVYGLNSKILKLASIM